MNPSFPFSADTDFSLLDEQIAANPVQWEAVFDFLKNIDLASLPVGRHSIVEGGAYANVSEYETKTDGVFEAHRDYIDIQIVVSGNEVIEVAALDDALDCTLEYDKDRDVVLYSSASKFRSYVAGPSEWFVFFPCDLHKPGCAKDGILSHVRKIVVKVPMA